MDIVVKGRHRDVPERFRAHVIDKLAKLERFEHRPLHIDVEISKEHNPRLASVSDRVEITAHSRGPVIRAEAAAADPYGALDLAFAKLEKRMRRQAERKRYHQGHRRAVSLAEATAIAGADLPSLDGDGAAGAVSTDVEDQLLDPDDEGPMVVREKVHRADPMSLDQALYEMELVGHDFYLFVDEDSKQPSVVYRRRAYDYGVIRLEV